MALNEKGTGFDLNKRMNRNGTTDARTQESTPTHTDTPEYAPAHLPTVGKGERKTERLQLLVRPSTKSRLAKYAEAHNTSSNEVVQRLLDKLLDESGY